MKTPVNYSPTPEIIIKTDEVVINKKDEQVIIKEPEEVKQFKIDLKNEKINNYDYQN